MSRNLRISPREKDSAAREYPAPLSFPLGGCPESIGISGRNASEYAIRPILGLGARICIGNAAILEKTMKTKLQVRKRLNSEKNRGKTGDPPIRRSPDLLWNRS